MKKQKGNHDCYMKGAQGVYGWCTGLIARLCQTCVCSPRACCLCLLVVRSGSRSKGVCAEETLKMGAS